MLTAKYNKNSAILSLLLGIIICMPQMVLAGDAINTTFFGNLAIKGYDPVAYFLVNKPVKGEKQYTYSWRDANWRFSSQENLDLFKADPEKYAPQYGGYCAYAVAQNKVAGIDPTQFTVHNGKLYLNYNEKINRLWLNDKIRFIDDADKNWPALFSK